MKLLRFFMVVCAVSVSPFSAADANEKQLVEKVASIMIESHSRYININLLSEICALDTSLNINTKSHVFAEDLDNALMNTARATGVKKFDANRVKTQAVEQFESFMKGLRYGGSIADSFVKSRNVKLCPNEIKTIVLHGIHDLQQQPMYLVNIEK